MDDMVFPAYSTHKVKSKSYEFNESEFALQPAI
jgi:hypothetical protein